MLEPALRGIFQKLLNLCDNFQGQTKNNYQAEAEAMKCLFENKINQLKLQIMVLQEASQADSLVQLRDRVIEDQKKEISSVKKELQRVKMLYVKHKVSIGDYKKRVRDLESTNQIYYKKISEMVKLNEKLENGYKTILATKKNQGENSELKSSFNSIIKINKKVFAEIKKVIKEKYEELKKNPLDDHKALADSLQSPTSQFKKILMSPPPQAKSVSMPRELESSLKGSEFHSKPKFATTLSQDRLFASCLKEVAKKVKERNSLRNLQSYYSMRKPGNDWKMTRDEKKFLVETMVSKYDQQRRLSDSSSNMTTVNNLRAKRLSVTSLLSQKLE
ncbi:unnamed protein product [Moneuplotes crassus]|uniref:Uncharacterized protein n=1 Tax=Euplotes crassus TaxID=5936 RepID=A0AAD1ULE6_EUPCR|nr:unnamed protein product [Moneuplotes crassus]